MTTENDLHPIRFTFKQVGLIKHIMGHFTEYFEEEAAEFFETVEASEEGMSKEEKELSR